MIWLVLHSAAIILLTTLFLVTGASDGGQTAAALGEPARAWVPAVALALESFLAFVWLFAEAGRAARRPANIVTGVRLVVALGVLATLAPDDPSAALAIGVFAAAVLGELTDLFDGIIARRTGTSSFGSRLDTETDALFILALSLLAFRWYGVPAWVAAAGLSRYAFALPFLALPEPRFPASFARFAKTACAVAAVLLIATVAPVAVGSVLRTALAAAAVFLIAVSFAWEAALRVRAMRTNVHDRIENGADDDPTASRAARRTLRRGLLKSVLTYYGVPLRQYRTRRLYRSFVRPGDLVFDIGSHVGNRIVALRGLGARVVAVEPQPHCVRFLRRWFEADDEVELVAAACSDSVSTATLQIASANPTLSTISGRWVSSITEHYPDQQLHWDRAVAVSTTTLDRLIAHYGTPRFVKIDVEGLEPQVLAGLTEPVEVISFEFLPASMETALASLRRIDALGDYLYNYSMVESMALASPRWLSSREMTERLAAMPPTGRSGDVYARRSG